MLRPATVCLYSCVDGCRISVHHVRVPMYVLTMKLLGGSRRLRGDVAKNGCDTKVGQSGISGAVSQHSVPPLSSLKTRNDLYTHRIHLGCLPTVPRTCSMVTNSLRFSGPILGNIRVYAGLFRYIPRLLPPHGSIDVVAESRRWRRNAIHDSFK